jgi:hypothetical protein
MRRTLGFFLSLVLLGILLSSCASHHRVLVLYDRTNDLKPGDRVYWENQVIGSVGTFEKNPKGKTIVPLQIHPDFRQTATDQSRFIIQGDPHRPGSQSVRMALLAIGGKPLADGATVEGSTNRAFMVEKGAQGIQSWSKLLGDAIDRLEKEMRRLSETEWQKELERQIENWTGELKGAGVEMRRYFQKEILPWLEQAVQDLLRRLKELGRGDDGKTLEEKFEQLKRTLYSGK